MLVVDASIAIYAINHEQGFATLEDRELVAPALMWSETRSVLHAKRWRRELADDDAEILRRRLESSPVRLVHRARLGDEAWRLADELGWAKTYDAEYLAVASLLGCRLVTLDGKLRRGADRLGLVVSPEELNA